MDNHLLRNSKENKRFCLIDYETDGLITHPSVCKAWQVGIINLLGDQIENEHDILIKWKTPFNFNPQIVNRLFKTTVQELNARIQKNGVSPETAFETMYNSLENANYIVGSNILGFDIHIIFHFYKMFGKDPRHLTRKVLDTHCLAKGMKLGIPYTPDQDLTEYQYKLLHKRVKGVKTGVQTLAKEFGIPFDPDTLHDAIIDLTLTHKIFNQLLYRLEI